MCVIVVYVRTYIHTYVVDLGSYEFYTCRPHTHTHIRTYTCKHVHAHAHIPHMHTHAHMLQLAHSSMLLFLRVSDRSLRCGHFTLFDGGHPLQPALALILAATPTPSTPFERQKEMPSLSSFLATWILLSRR